MVEEARLSSVPYCEKMMVLAGLGSTHGLK
jgi:hypothetical protein